MLIFVFVTPSRSFLVIAISFSDVVAFGGGGRSSGAGSRGGGQKTRGNYPYSMPGLGNEYGNSRKSKEAVTQPKPSGRNISTPQIVFILTLIMTLGFAGYYFIQFYPFLCSKESKYDVMSRCSAPTPTHSREFEYDESTSSATKSTNASYSNEHDV